VQRGDVYWATLDSVEGSEWGGRRPVVIVSRDAITASSPNVIVLPMFSLENFQKIYPSQTVLRSNDSGLIGDGVVMAEQIRTISETRLQRYVSHLSAEALKKIDEILKVTLALKD
jgi:mRNA interferase MazF